MGGAERGTTLLYIERSQLSWLQSLLDASLTPFPGEIPDMSHRTETPGRTRESLEGLCFKHGLETPQRKFITNTKKDNFSF